MRHDPGSTLVRISDPSTVGGVRPVLEAQGMATAKAKSILNLEGRMGCLSPDSFRYKVLEAAKGFKREITSIDKAPRKIVQKMDELVDLPEGLTD